MLWWLVAVPLFAFVVLGAALFWPLPEAKPRRVVPDGSVWTYAEARDQLPASIRDDFHPEWPWLDPQPRPNEQQKLENEIRALQSGDRI